MVRGTHKQMVVLRTNGNRYYEQAYFVLRDGQPPLGEAETTMIAEANRILDESMLMPQPRRRKWTLKTAFFVGMAVGTLLAAAVGIPLWLVLAAV